MIGVACLSGRLEVVHVHRAWFVTVLLVAVVFAAPLFASVPAAAQAPAITIVSPKVTTVSTLGLRIEVAVTDFILDQANYGLAPIPGHGHIHYTVDGGGLIATWLTFVDTGSLAPGTHVVRAELRNNDHSPLSPAVFQEITVDGIAPSITIVSPKVTSVSSLGFRIEVAIAGLELDEANYGGFNVAGRGHIHYTVDGGALIARAATAVDIGALSAGQHVIRAELRNNNHSALSPAMFQELTVTAAAPSITIVSPKTTAVPTIGFRIQVAVVGFELDEANYGGTPINGRGHIHYTVDGGSLIATASPVVDIGALSAGAHVIRAELRQNNHAPLSPAAFQEITVTAGTPSITIVSPKATTVGTLGFRIQVAVSGFILDAENYAGTPFNGHGHMHYTVDGGSLIATASSVVDIGALSAGAHVIRAELRQNNHAPLSPAVFQELTVTAVPPAISIVSPEVTGVSTLGFRIQVAIVGFELDGENYAGTNIAGRGHIHYTVDGGALIATASPAVDLAALGPGPHTIRAELRNNDHSALSPAVFAEIAVNAGAPRIRVLEPTAGATESTLGFRVHVAIENFSFDMVNYGGEKIPGQGHYHVMLGTQLLGAPLTDSFVVTGLSAGLQTLNVSIRNNDHSPIDPAAFVLVTVTVAAPSIQASVSSASVQAGGTVIVSWAVGGFVLDSAAFGAAPEAGRGHVHIFLDGTYVTATASDTIAITDLTAGTHTIKVQLFNNDHSALATEVSDEVNVQSTAPPAPAAAVDASVFYGALVALLVVIGVLVALLVRKGRGGRPEPMKPETRE